MAFPSYTNDSGAISSIDVAILAIVNLTVTSLPALSIATNVYSPFSLIAVPLVNGSPLSVTLSKFGSVITGVTESVYFLPSSTPFISGKSSSIVNVNVATLNAASTTVTT